MSRTLRSLFRWTATEHGIVIGVFAVAGLLATLPLVAEYAFPLSIPGHLAPPTLSSDGPERDPGVTSTYAAAHILRSYGYLRAIGEGSGSLLWNPTEFAGVPFLAQWTTRALSPFSIPFYLLRPDIAFWFSVYLKILVAGLLAHYVCRVIGLSHAFATFAGIVYALGTTLVVQAGMPVSDAAPWIPLLFLFAERLSLGQVRYWPSGALALGLMLLSGAPFVAVSSAIFFALYGVLRRRKVATRHVLGPMMSAGVAVVLGLGLAMMQLSPYVEWLGQSTPVWQLRHVSPGLQSLFFVFGPFVSATGIETRAATALHIGMVPLLLTALWITLHRFAPEAHRRRVDAILVLGWGWWAVGLLIAVFQPNFSMLQRLSLAEFLIPCSFAVAVGAAASAEAWLELRPEDSLTTLRRFVFVLTALVGLAVASHACAYAVVPGAGAAIVRSGLATGLTIVVFALVLGVTLVRPWPRFMGYALAGASILQLLLFTLPVQPRTSWRTAGPLVIDPNAARRFVGPGVSERGLNSLNGVGLGGFGPRMPSGLAPFLVRADDDPLLLRRAGIDTFVLGREELEGPFGDLRALLHWQASTGDAAAAFTYREGTQRLRMIHEADVVPEFDGDALDSTRPAVVNTDVDLGGHQRGPGQPIREPGGNPARFAINVYKTDPGLLVLADTAYPGWLALVDLRLADMVTVDGAFRGVEVPVDSRTVEFRYLPASYPWGRIVALACLSICLLGWAHLVYFRMHHQHFKM